MVEEKTDREKERASEDAKYEQVIIKRIDEALRHPDDTLEKALEEGHFQYKRNIWSAFLSAAVAGAILGISTLLVGLIAGDYEDAPKHIQTLAKALIYPLGFIICIFSGTLLFTEQTATAVYPVLSKKTHWTSLIRLWNVIYLGNILGSLIISLLLYAIYKDTAQSSGFLVVYDHLNSSTTLLLFLKAILAGWLMAQAGWLIMATHSTTAQILFLYVATFIIGYADLYHSIAGASEYFIGFFLKGEFHFFQLLRFFLVVMFGNLIGGSFLVGLLNFAHIKSA